MLDSLNIIVFTTILTAVNAIPLSINCGKQLHTNHPNWRIICGNDAAIGEFPWQITLNPNNDTNPNFRNFCGGTVINKKWILTAAHCMVNMTFNVRLGVHNESIHESSEIISEIEKIISHENYTINNRTIENDIALLKLKKTLDFSGIMKNIAPICLAREDTKLTKKCVATGWGNTEQHSFVRPINGILKKVDLKIIDGRACTNMEKTEFIESTQVCVYSGSPTGGHSVCNMDSGGPLQCLAEDGRWYQVGVTSYGYSRVCGLPNEPDVFTKVSAYIDWIEKILADN